MTKLYLIALLFGCISISTAQTESEPADTVFSRSEAIPKHRKILYHQLRSGNVEMARKTFRYLDSLANETYSPFEFYEDVDILIFTGDFIKASEKARQMDEAKHQAFARTHRPKDDSLSQLVADSLSARRKTVEEAIRQSVTDTTIADFLLLYLAHFQDGANSKYLNDLGGQFLTKHPKSPHEYYVRHFIRYVWRRTGAFEMGFLLGGNGLTQTLGSNFATYPSFGLFIGGGFGRFEFQTMVTAGGGKTKKKMLYPGGTLFEHADYNMGEAKFLVGYKLFPYYPLSLTPLAGGGILQIGPTGKDFQGQQKVISAAKLNSASVFCVGAEMDVNINATRSTLSERRYSHFFIVLGLQYMYSQVRFANPYVPTNGGIHSLTLKIGFGTGAYRRVF